MKERTGAKPRPEYEKKLREIRNKQLKEAIKTSRMRRNADDSKV